MSSNFSIYIPAYNAERTINLCINSILSQTIKPEVILVINDGSTDNTYKILKDYGDKIITIHNKKYGCKSFNEYCNILFKNSLHWKN